MLFCLPSREDAVELGRAEGTALVDIQSSGYDLIEKFTRKWYGFKKRETAWHAYLHKNQPNIL